VAQVQGREITTLYQAVVCSRLRVEQARGELVEALGDWLCGSGTPPGVREIESLALLTAAQEEAEAEYARHIAVLSNALVARLRRSRTHL